MQPHEMELPLADPSQQFDHRLVIAPVLSRFNPGIGPIRSFTSGGCLLFAERMNAPVFSPHPTVGWAGPQHLPGGGAVAICPDWRQACLYCCRLGRPNGKSRMRAFSARPGKRHHLRLSAEFVLDKAQNIDLGAAMKMLKKGYDLSGCEPHGRHID
jgi:hypothetical protein